ncbi:MAG TPA: type I DNA topoisomerase [Bacillota bacterium]|nr:type I DNA topoisomerase [Bacillota bacterium]
MATAKKKDLVIVESPSKANTIRKFLGSKYEVIASVGHLRDLPKSRLGVNIEDSYSPDYINVRGKSPTINAIKAAAKKADKIYLATDPDREGEAISWHICHLLGIDPAQANRVSFQEITKPAVAAAIKDPRPINMELVDSQQGRRVIDRLVGFQISPLLWQKVGKGLSAGRVQSAALKIVCDREREIRAFVPKEYWNINAELKKLKGAGSFTAKLDNYKGKKLTIDCKEDADRVLAELKAGEFSVSGVKKKKEEKKPLPPFITSTLMQDASSRLGYSPDKTRMLAQQLYEGCQVKGRGTIGLVTYIRTDSVRISDDADAACKSFIDSRYGKEYVGNNSFANRRASVQDAHEAIRPSYVELTPEELSDSLSADQYKLYKLIWSRFVASRMKPAVFAVETVDIDCASYGFKANGRVQLFEGFQKVYGPVSPEKDQRLPELAEGEKLSLKKLSGEQRFTEPPSRYTEASLIKELEDLGIGRPSTYASIVTTLDSRRYVKKDRKALVPTELGFKINEDIMEVYFKEIVDSGFTAGMEDALDRVEEGKVDWREVVGRYYEDYVKEQLRSAEETLEKTKIGPELTGEDCPLCGKPLAKRQSRFGSFTGCTGYPECRYIKTEVVSVGVPCPKCGKDIIRKRSRKGKTFFGCSGYPDCDQVFWYKPVNKNCPDCGSLLVERGRKYVCSNDDCAYREERPDYEGREDS